MRRTLLAALAALAVAVPTAFVGSSAQAAPSGLPTDPAAHGYIGFCDEAGHNVTGGSVDSAPFVWKSVASVPPPAQFQGTGQNAVLNAYQPRQDVLPAQYSGSSLTAASFYSTPAHPAVQATYADQSLATLIAQFPPQINGLYVLRMYYGKANYGLYNRSYPTTTIQVVGTRWTVVSGGTVDCATAKGVSNEQLTGVVTRREVTPRTGTAADGSGSGAATTASSGSTPGPISRAPVSVAPGSSGAAVAGASASSTHRDDGGSPLPWLIALVVVVGLAAVGGVVLRHRTRSS